MFAFLIIVSFFSAYLFTYFTRLCANGQEKATCKGAVRSPKTQPQILYINHVFALIATAYPVGA